MKFDEKIGFVRSPPKVYLPYGVIGDCCFSDTSKVKRTSFGATEQRYNRPRSHLVGNTNQTIIREEDSRVTKHTSKKKEPLPDRRESEDLDSHCHFHSFARYDPVLRDIEWARRTMECSLHDEALTEHSVSSKRPTIVEDCTSAETQSFLANPKQGIGCFGQIIGNEVHRNHGDKRIGEGLNEYDQIGSVTSSNPILKNIEWPRKMVETPLTHEPFTRPQKSYSVRTNLRVLPNISAAQGTTAKVKYRSRKTHWCKEMVSLGQNFENELVNHRTENTSIGTGEGHARIGVPSFLRKRVQDTKRSNKNSGNRVNIRNDLACFLTAERRVKTESIRKKMEDAKLRNGQARRRRYIRNELRCIERAKRRLELNPEDSESHLSAFSAPFIPKWLQGRDVTNHFHL